MYVISHVTLNPSTVHLLEPDSQLFKTLAYGVIKLEPDLAVTHLVQRGFSHRVPLSLTVMFLANDFLGLLSWQSIHVFMLNPFVNLFMYP